MLAATTFLPCFSLVASWTPVLQRTFTGNALLTSNPLLSAVAAEPQPLVWSESPDNEWTFDEWDAAPDLKVNYISAGPSDGQPFLLIHGFGASGFHWRRNVNVLAAAGHRVYAIDVSSSTTIQTARPCQPLHSPDAPSLAARRLWAQLQTGH